MTLTAEWDEIVMWSKKNDVKRVCFTQSGLVEVEFFPHKPVQVALMDPEPAPVKGIDKPERSKKDGLTEQEQVDLYGRAFDQE